MAKLYMHLDKKELKSSEKEATNASIGNDANNEDAKNWLLYEGAEIKETDIEYENGMIHLYGDIIWRNKNLGFMDIELRPDPEITAQIIEAHVKMLNKVRTMLEATK